MTKKYILIILLTLTLCFCETSWSRNQDEREAREQEIRELYETYDDLFKVFLANTNAELGKNVAIYEEISPGLFPKKITFQGSYRDVGKWLGLMARKQGIYPTLRTEESREINEKIEAMYGKFFPPFLERARGIAWAYSQNLENLDLRNIEDWFAGRLWWELFRYDDFLRLTRFTSSTSTENCSVISYYIEEEQRMLTGRNFDIYDDRPHFQVVSNLSGVYRSVGMTCYQLQNKIMDGINERGLFMAIASNILPPEYTSYDEEPYPQVAAICSPRLIRVILDCCATVEEALALIRKVRIWFPDELQHFLIADASGRSVVIEFDRDKKLHVFPTTECYQVMTNTAFLEGPDYLYQNCTRFRRATDLCALGVTNMEEFWEVVCSIQARFGTTLSIWTSRADLKKLEYDTRFHSENWEVPHVLTIQ